MKRRIKIFPLFYNSYPSILAKLTHQCHLRASFLKRGGYTVTHTHLRDSAG